MERKRIILFKQNYMPMIIVVAEVDCEYPTQRIPNQIGRGLTTSAATHVTWFSHAHRSPPHELKVEDQHMSPSAAGIWLEQSSPRIEWTSAT